MAKFPEIFRDKNIRSNFLSLSGVQAINFIIPLIIYPILIRKLGIEKFGLVAFAQTFITYFVIINEYGFGITGTKSISASRDNRQKLSEISSSIFGAKALLALGTFLPYLSIIYLVPFFNSESALYLWSYVLVVGQIFLPYWFFQGVERMQYQTFFSLASRLLYLIAIIFLVREESDYVFVIFYLGISNFISGLFSLHIMRSRFGIGIGQFRMREILRTLRSGGQIFVSNFATFVSTNSYITVLGFFVDNLTLGYYAIAEKLFIAMRAVAVVLYQAVFPRVCMLAMESKEKLIRFLRGFVRGALVVFIPLTAGVFLLSDHVVFLFAGAYSPEAILYLRILCFVPLFASLNIPACQTLLAYDHHRDYLVVSLIGAGLSLLSNLLFLSLWSATGTAIATLTTEMIIAIMFYFSLVVIRKQYAILSIFNFKIDLQ